MRNTKLWKILFKTYRSPYDPNVRAYWINLVAALLFALLILDVPQALGMGNTMFSVCLGVLEVLILLPVLNIWPTAFPPPEEDPTGDPEGEAVRNRARREVYYRLALVLAPAVYMLITTAGMRAMIGNRSF